MNILTGNIKKLIVLVLICFVSLTSYSQSKDVDWNALHAKMMKHKREFLKKELQLNEDQMTKFWDVYLQYDKEIQLCHGNAWRKQCELTNADTNKCQWVSEDSLSDDVASQLIEQRLITERQLLDIEEKYSRDFVRILSPQKALKLHRLEQKFMRDVMSKGPKDGEKKDNKRK